MTSTPSLRGEIAADVEAYLRNAAAFLEARTGVLRTASVLLTPPLLCSLLYRISHRLWRRGARRTAAAVAWLNFVLHKADVSPAAEIGRGLYIPHVAGVVFHGRAGRRLTLLARAVVAPGPRREGVDTGGCAGPTLGDDVTVGADAVVLGAVTLGDGVRIAPGAVCRVSLAGGATLFPGTRAVICPRELVS